MTLRKSPKYKSPFWGCTNFPQCRGTHGAHPDGRPLGVPADGHTKKSRMAAHAQFDRLWKEFGLPRSTAYSLLAKELSLPVVHIGEADIGMCNKILTAALKLIGEINPCATSISIAKP